MLVWELQETRKAQSLQFQCSALLQRLACKQLVVARGIGALGTPNYFLALEQKRTEAATRAMQTVSLSPKIDSTTMRTGTLSWAPFSVSFRSACAPATCRSNPPLSLILSASDTPSHSHRKKAVKCEASSQQPLLEARSCQITRRESRNTKPQEP